MTIFAGNSDALSEAALIRVSLNVNPLFVALKNAPVNPR